MSVLPAFDQLELVFPLQIKKALGEEASEQFIVAVKKAKKAGPFVACNAAIPLIEDLVWERLEEFESEREVVEASPNQIFPPITDNLDTHK